jgi:hypothetical protein
MVPIFLDAVFFGQVDKGMYIFRLGFIEEHPVAHDAAAAGQNHRASFIASWMSSATILLLDFSMRKFFPAGV